MHAKPGFETTITTVGHSPPYRPGQFIKLKDTPAFESLKFRVISVDHKYTSEKNEWLTDIAALQISPGALGASSSSSSSG